MSKARRGPLAWRKSSYSMQGNCLEVALDDDLVHVRDSKDPDGYRLAVPRAAWTTFIGSVGHRPL